MKNLHKAIEISNILLNYEEHFEFLLIDFSVPLSFLSDLWQPVTSMQIAPNISKCFIETPYCVQG